MTDQLPFTKELKVLAPGAAFSTVLLLTGRQARTAKNQKPFLNIELTDRVGSFTANIWSDARFYAGVDALPDGSIVSVSGQADFWDGKFSPKIESIAVVDKAGEAAYYERLVAVSWEDPGKMRSEFGGFVSSIQDAGLKNLVAAVFSEVGKDFFFSSPAARAIHHAWRHGLVEHTLGMLRLAESVIKLYPKLPFDRDIVISGIALHDLCKVGEYSQDLSAQLTIKGRLIGHVSMIYGLIVKHGAALKLPDKTVDALGHIVLSHHGRQEYGAPVAPATPEALLVSQIDMLDSRLGALQAVIRSDGDKSVTGFAKGLDTQVVLPKNVRDPASVA